MNAKSEFAGRPELSAAGGTPPVGSGTSASDVMQVLAEFETGLTSLKALYVERQQIQEKLTLQQAELDERQATLTKQRAELDELAAQVAEAHASNKGRAEQIEAAQRQFETEISTRQAELDARFAALQAEQQDLLANQRKQDEARIELDRRASELAAQVASFESHQRETEAKAAAAQAELTDRIKRAEQVQAELDVESASVERRKSELISRQKRLDEAALAQTEAARIAETATLARASELESLQADIASEAESLRKAKSDLAAREAALETRERSRREGESTRDDLMSQLAAATEESKRQEAARQALLNDTQVVFEEYEALLAAEREASVQAMAEADALNNDVERLASAVEVLKTRLAEAREKEAAATAEAAERPSTVRSIGADAPAWWNGRRARLRRYRDMVRANAVKVRKASEGLSKRFEQCEQVLSHRAELAAIRERVLEADRRSQRQKAGSRAVTAVFCGIAGLAILGGLSWALARQVAPARFIAESVLVAEGRGRELNGPERAEWQRFHEGVLKDPMFHETAAERFKRQGSSDLATPGAIDELITTSVTTESLGDGELRIRMSGLGADKTARTLDTFSASLASFANASQQRRIDGGATRISQPAKAGDTPIDHTRTIYALGMLATAASVSLGATIGIWKKLSRVKSQFEQDEQVAMTLDDARWVEPPSVSELPKTKPAPKGR